MRGYLKSCRGGEAGTALAIEVRLARPKVGGQVGAVLQHAAAARINGRRKRALGSPRGSTCSISYDEVSILGLSLAF